MKKPIVIVSRTKDSCGDPSCRYCPPDKFLYDVYVVNNANLGVEICDAGARALGLDRLPFNKKNKVKIELTLKVVKKESK